jgi:hypothetical protein
MIRRLRRWLLGVEPEGPPLAADPLYRWEVRRYWTWRRYSWIVLVIVGLGAIALGCVLWIFTRTMKMALTSAYVGLPDLTVGQVLMICGASVASMARFPLCILAVIGAALAVAPERRTGQIEQFVLTPVDPWRFAVARMAGRFRGLFLIWLGVGVVMAASMVLLDVFGLPRLRGAVPCPQAMGLNVLRYGVVHFDLGLMLALDTVVGFSLSVSARSAAGAVAKACLVSMVLLPLILYLPMFGLSAIDFLPAVRRPASTEEREIIIAVVQLVGIVLHTALGAGALAFFLRRARRNVERAFDDPEGAA